jgi:hypothetical protein
MEEHIQVMAEAMVDTPEAAVPEAGAVVIAEMVVMVLVALAPAEAGVVEHIPEYAAIPRFRMFMQVAVVEA